MVAKHLLGRLRIKLGGVLNVAKVENALRLFLMRFLNTPEMKSPKRVLLVRLDYLGDLAITYPTLLALREYYPEAQIDIVVGSWNQQLANLFSFDNVYVWDSKRLTRNGKVGNIVDRSLQCLKILRNYKKNSLVVNLAPSFVFLLMEHVLRVPVRSYPHLSRSKRLKMGICGHQAFITLQTALGDRASDNMHQLQQVWDMGQIENGKVAVLSPGSGNSLRRWTSDKWGALSVALQKMGYKVSIVGSKSEYELAEDIRMLGTGKELNLAGQTDLSQLVRRLSTSSLLVGCDSGTLHLAAVMGIPTIGLYGPQNPKLWGPIGSSSTSIYYERECSPCAQTYCPFDKGHRCMDDITVEDILDAVEKGRARQGVGGTLG